VVGITWRDRRGECQWKDLPGGAVEFENRIERDFADALLDGELLLVAVFLLILSRRTSRAWLGAENSPRKSWEGTKRAATVTPKAACKFELASTGPRA